MTQLICEGTCNPDLARVDRAVSVARASSPYDGAPIGDERLYVQQRALRYTAHDATEREFVRVCTVCGTRRRFGSGKWAVRDEAAS